MMHKLTDSADVFVENYRPGALEKLGLGYTELAARNPKLVYCSVSAYGHTGPDSREARVRSDRRGEERRDGDDRRARRAAAAVPDRAGRHVHGDPRRGRRVRRAARPRQLRPRPAHRHGALRHAWSSMHEYAVQCYTLSGGKELPVQTGHDLPQSTVYGVFAGRDGYFVIAAQVDDAWKRLAKLIGGDALAADARFHRSGGAQRAPRGDPAEDPRLDDGAALGQGVHRRARCRRRCRAPRSSASTRCWPIRRSRRAA